MNHSTIARTLARGLHLSVAAALLGGLLAVTHTAQADFYIVVENTNDSGIGSLRNAITEAYNDPDPNTIIFDESLNGIPIVLTGVAGENSNASGDLDILGNGDLTIQGNGVANTIIDGGGIDRVFHICPGGGCTTSVTLDGVTIRNGKVTGDGGGIYNAAGSVTVNASNVSNNLAYNDGGGIFNKGTLNIQNGSIIGGSGTHNWANDEGGGIFNQYTGITTVDGSAVSANTADYGGGILNQGMLNIQNSSTIGGVGAGNTASNEGGGIYNQAGATTTVTSSAVSANTADKGGGIYNQATLDVQKGSTIGGAGAGNQAIWSGGGIHNTLDGTTTVDSSAVCANTATFGGGIYNDGDFSHNAVLYVHSGSTIGGAGTGNTAGNSGGGIFNGIYSTTTVDGSTVSANTAFFGGGIYNNDTLIILNSSTIGGPSAGNQAWGDDNFPGAGGGIYNYHGGHTTVTDSRILNNSASNGGGVFNGRNDTEVVIVTGSCIVNNSDTSFFNNQPAVQIATNNWWGAAAGPDTFRADTVSINVTYAPFLTEPILGCGLGGTDIYLPLVLK